ncbi:hypothetical protein SDC9_110872 [bioreactor metagenome]|uniref:Uncharacterized protein n=1 Tax=bioreactor metagenome TaxID=1076179 RepID=A0A645BF79_9ZZZZ
MRRREALAVRHFDRAAAEHGILFRELQLVDAVNDRQRLDERVVAAPGLAAMRALARNGDANQRPAFMPAHDMQTAALGNDHIVRVDIRVRQHHRLHGGAFHVLFGKRAGNPHGKRFVEPKLLECARGKHRRRERAFVVHRAPAVDYAVFDFCAERVKAPVGCVARFYGVDMRVVQQNGLSAADSAEHVAHFVHPDLVKAELLHLPLQKAGGILLMVRYAFLGDELGQKANHLLLMRLDIRIQPPQFFLYVWHWYPSKSATSMDNILTHKTGHLTCTKLHHRPKLLLFWFFVFLTAKTVVIMKPFQISTCWRKLYANVAQGKAPSPRTGLDQRRDRNPLCCHHRAENALRARPAHRMAQEQVAVHAVL